MIAATLDDVKALVRRLIRPVIADYKLNWIYGFQEDAGGPVLPPGLRLTRITDREAAIVARDPDRQLHHALGFGDAGATGFVVLDGERPCCIVHYVDRDHYDDAAIWPLRPDEIALVDLVTSVAARGRGIAPAAITASSHEMLRPPVIRAIAFVWWSHAASRRAFAKAGWHRIGFSINLTIAGRVWRLHIPIGWHRGWQKPGR